MKSFFKNKNFEIYNNNTFEVLDSLNIKEESFPPFFSISNPVRVAISLAVATAG